MEFCPNGDLLQLVNRQENVDLVKIGKEVLYGLNDLHRYGKVHRDLKPENVLIKMDGTAVLTDFGISGDRKKRITVTDLFGRPTEITGTVIYMAPEQAKPKNREVTVLPTMDIFAFGVMMYQLITGVFPFGPLNNEDDMVLYIKNAREGNWNRQELAKYREGSLFVNVISGCLNPDFKQRLQTVENVLQLLPQSSSQPGTDTNVHHAPPPAVNGVLLRVMQGEDYGAVYKLNDYIAGTRKMITVGCNDPLVKNILPITENMSRYISRKHCTLELFSHNQWIIRDGQWDKTATNGWKQSLNGTYVNSTETTLAGMPVMPGDIISIGDVKLRVEGY
jgi:serine/threonine protein kinase